MAGITAGAALALTGLLDTPTALGDDVAAVVGDTIISRDDHRRAVEALRADSRAEALDRYALDRLIDEAILVERGARLDLLRRDRSLRAAVGQRVIDMVTDDGDAPEATVLAEFYAANQAFFAAPARLRVEARTFASADAAHRALQRAEAGGAIAELISEVPTLRGPVGLVPLDRIATWLGSSVARRAATLAAGEATIVDAGGRHILVAVMDRIDPLAPPLAEVEAQVQAEWRRREADSRLSAFLDQQRTDLAITIAEDLR